MTIPSGVLRRWWPALVIVLLAVVSVDVLHSSFQRLQRSREDTVAAVDQLAQTRLRMMRALLVLEGNLGAEPTFEGNAAAAELQTARDALDDWLAGRSAILNVRGSPVLDAHLAGLTARYGDALETFHDAVLAGDPGSVEARTLFSNAESAAHALESAVYAALRDSIRAENRQYWLRLGAWALFIAFGGLGVSVAHRRQRRAESGQERSETRLSRLRALAPVGIIACDDDGRIRLANQWWCDATALPEGEWLGRRWWEALAPMGRQEAAARWDEVVAGRQPAAVELQLADTPGQTAPVWVLTRWAPNPAGDAEGRWVVTFTDVTERRRVEEELRQAHKMKVIGQLTGGIAHDFNNLLAIIVANAAMLHDTGSVAPDDLPLLDDLRQAADGGTELVRTLLQFSRRTELRMQPVQLGWIIDQNASLARRLLPDEVELRVDVAADVPVIQADPGTLQQVLLNLVTNARDAMPEGGRITVEARRVDVGAPDEEARRARAEPAEPAGRERPAEPPGPARQAGPATHDVPPGSYGVLAVRDTGCGIEEKILHRIFESFFTTKEPGRGTGLGLSTVQTMVRRHGGYVRVESEMGRGTHFRLYFPSAEEGAGGTAGATGTAEAGKGGREQPRTSV